jgi:hypothetical protein
VGGGSDTSRRCATAQYLEEDAIGELLAFTRAHLAASAFLSYDQIGPHDPFGDLMAATLRQRGSPLNALHAAPDCDAMRRRFAAAGYEQVWRAGMLQHTRVSRSVLAGDFGLFYA